MPFLPYFTVELVFINFLYISNIVKGLSVCVSVCVRIYIFIKIILFIYKNYTNSATLITTKLQKKKKTPVNGIK